MENISKKSKIVWNKTAIPLLIKSYDFSTLMHYYIKPNKDYILVTKGVKHPLIPVHPSYTRSVNIMCINVLKPLKRSEIDVKNNLCTTEITCISHVKYGGTLPYFLNKKIFRGTVKYLYNLREKVNKNNL